MSNTNNESRSKELRLLVKRAALTLDAKCGMNLLAEKCGVNPASIRRAIRCARFSPGMASAIEIAVGRDVLKREELCPEKFASQE